MLPDLNRLHIFFHIYSRQSIVAAADVLNITPSAVSQQLKKLEAEIKTPLFTRSGKRLVPTTAGKRLIAIVKPFIEDLEKDVSHLRKARNTPSGILRIGAPIEFGKIYLPGIFSTYRDRFKDVTFYMKLGRPSALLPLVSNGDLDFAFVDTFPARERLFDDFRALSIAPILEEEVVLACSKQYHEVSLSGDYSFKNLADQSFISQQTGTRALNNWFLHHFGKTAPPLQVVLTVENHQAVIAAIKNHMGLGIIVSHIVWNEIARGDLVRVETDADPAINSISLVMLQDKVSSLAEKSFLAHLNGELEKSTLPNGIQMCRFQNSPV